MRTSKNKIKSLMLALVLSVAAISAASARVCFLPDSTDCGSSDVDIPDVPCKYSSCPAYNSKYQTCYTERIYNNGGTLVECKQVKCNISKSECEEQAKATSHSCKFDDASGCYYLGECKKCNRDVYDLKEPKSGSDWECDSCTGCDGTVYSCRYKQSCEGLNYSTSCSDSQIAKEVIGVKDSHGNQCYTCESKPVDGKCVDIEATPFLDIIEPTVKTVKASGEIKEVNATLECGINPKKAYKYEAKIITNYDYLNLPVQRIKPVEYRFHAATFSGSNYFYKTSINGKNVCVTDRLCAQYAKEGIYISAYYIRIQDMSTKKDAKLYCCKTDDDFKGDMLSHLSSSCKEVLPSYFESDDMDYLEPFYVCDEGIKDGTKCKIGSYTCPKDYKLSGSDCVKKECPENYALISDDNKDICVQPTFSCPTDGKYKYKLSGNQCVCDEEMVDKNIEVQFQYSLDGYEDAGHYSKCVYSSIEKQYNIIYPEEYCCSRNIGGEDYEPDDYHKCSDKYNTCSHTSAWNVNLSVFGGINSETWMLPYDMEIVVTYDIPYRNATECDNHGSENYGNGIDVLWEGRVHDSANSYVYAPRTVRIKIPKGSKVGTHVRKEPVDFWDEITSDHLTITYYVNGHEITSGNSTTIDGVIYSFENNGMEY